MNARLTMDKAGRIVLPKPLREELGLEAGDELEMASAGEQITLRPALGTRLAKEQGVWVFRAGEPLSGEAADGVLRRLRDERDAGNLKRKPE